MIVADYKELLVRNIFNETINNIPMVYSYVKGIKYNGERSFGLWEVKLRISLHPNMVKVLYQY